MDWRGQSASLSAVPVSLSVVAVPVVAVLWVNLSWPGGRKKRRPATLLSRWRHIGSPDTHDKTSTCSLHLDFPSQNTPPQISYIIHVCLSGMVNGQCAMCATSRV